jgi:micrococcal nuclease
MALACLAACTTPARGQPPATGAANPVNAWTTGGGPTTSTSGVAAGGTAAAELAQATPWPAYVIQGGTIPPNWQPQPIPMNGIGPDGRPTVHYYAPTYTFTYQIGPPVVGARQPWSVNRPQAASWQQPVNGQYPYLAGPNQPAAYAPNYNPPPYPYQAAPPQQNAFLPAPAVINQPLPQPALPPPAAAYAPGPQALQQPPQAWGPATASAGGWAGAPDVQQPAPTAAIGPPLPPVVPVPPQPDMPPMVPVPAGIPVQPASSGGAPPAAPPASRAANSHLWRVVKVYDGDTVTCLDDMNQEQKVRLAGIDAPEARQDFGQVSRQALAGMVFGKTIEVVDEGRDRYGRWIGRLYTAGIDVNQQMVATGNAWHYADYSKDPSLAAAQAQAQAQRIGIWSQPNPTPPWEYRKNQKKTQ